jgi:hypothetical protein
MNIDQHDTMRDLCDNECDKVSGGVNALPFKPSPEPFVKPKFPLPTPPSGSGPVKPFPLP